MINDQTITLPAHDLTGRIALVTGASSGIGERYARVLAAAGAAVVLAARRTGNLERIVASICDAGGRAMAVEMDASNEGSTIAAYDKAEAAFGLIDTIVANAGLNCEGPATSLAASEFDQVMAVNVRGVFLTAREGARRLIEKRPKGERGGRIVVTASITAEKVEAGLAAYSASKAAVVQLGKVMAREWIREDINVNMISPGYIKTELNGEWFETEAGAKQIAKWPRRRLMDESALDAMLLYLCSNESSTVTGQNFIIDDGQAL